MASTAKVSERQTRRKIWVEKTQLKLYRRYQRLVKELLTHCQDFTWEYEEVESYLDKIYALQDEIVTLCESNGINQEELAISWYLDSMSEIIEELLDEAETDEDVEFDFTEEQVEMLEEAMEVSEFEEEIEFEDDEEEE